MDIDAIYNLNHNLSRLTYIIIYYNKNIPIYYMRNDNMFCILCIALNNMYTGVDDKNAREKCMKIVFILCHYIGCKTNRGRSS